MNSKEKKTIIDVKVGGVRIALNVPFSRQDAVRETEAEMNAFLNEIRSKHSARNITECMAMTAYHYASLYFALKTQRDSETEEAEDLLAYASGLLEGDDGDTADTVDAPDEFDVY